MEGVNPSMIYLIHCKNSYKYHNVLSAQQQNFFQTKGGHSSHKKIKIPLQASFTYSTVYPCIHSQVITEHKMHVSDAVGTGNMASKTASLYTPKSAISATW
jgi:hypothetical protein